MAAQKEATTTTTSSSIGSTVSTSHSGNFCFCLNRQTLQMYVDLRDYCIVYINVYIVQLNLCKQIYTNKKLKLLSPTFPKKKNKAL